MADDTILNSGSGGNTFRTLEDGSSIHWPAGVTAFATTVGTPDVLAIVQPTVGLPVRLADGSGYLATLPVSLASVPSHAVTNAGTFAVQVDNTVTVASHAVTNAGTFAVQAAQSGTWTVTGAGGSFPVTDSSGSLTVDAPVGTPVFVRLSDGTDPIATLPVSLASVPSHAVTNAGTFVTQIDGSALTALQLLDDAVYVDDADWTDDTSKHLLVGGVYQSSPHTVTDGDVTPLLTDSNGRLAVAVNGTVTVGSHAVTNAGTFAVQAAQSGTWNVGTVTTVSAVTAISNALPAGTNNIGDVDILSIAAGDNNIGNVDIASIAAGDNNIGNVDIATVPADPFGANADAASATGSISAKLRFIAATGIPITGTVTVGSHAVTNAGTFAAQVDGAALTALQLIDNPVLVDDAAFTPASSSVGMAGFQADETATDSVDEGDAGAARMTLDRKQIVTPQPHTAGGCDIFRSIDLDEGTLEVVKASAGQLYGGFVTNLGTTTRFVKFYNATSGTAGTGTPVITLAIPGNATDDIGATFNNGGMGIAFATGICVGATTGVADNDTGAPGANEIVINLWYK